MSIDDPIITISKVREWNNKATVFVVIRARFLVELSSKLP